MARFILDIHERQGMTIVLIEHDMGLVMDISQRVVALDFGRKIAEGTFPSQVKISVHGAGWHESAINRWIADPVHYREEEPVE